MLLVAGSLSAQSNKSKQKYPQTKVYRGDSVVILSIDQSDEINRIFKQQTAAIDSFKMVTDTLVKYRDSVIVKYVMTDSVLKYTDSLKIELEKYKKKVEEAARLGLFVTYDSIREQAKFLPFDKGSKINLKETQTGVKIFATSYSQYTTSRLLIGTGLTFISGLAYGTSNEITNHPFQFKNTFPNMPTTFWDHYGKTGPSSWQRETRIGNIWFRSDLWHLSRATGVTAMCVGIPIATYESTTWKQLIIRSLIVSAGYTAGYNVATKIIIR